MHISHNFLCKAGTSLVGLVFGVSDAKASAVSLCRFWICNAKFHCCIQKNPPLQPSRTHFNSVHAISFRSTFTLSPYLCPGLWSRYSTSPFPVNNHIYIYIYIYIYTVCPRRNVPNFGRVFLMLKYTDITQNTYVQSWTVTGIMAREVWNFDSCYTLIDYQIHTITGRNMWFL